MPRFDMLTDEQRRHLAHIYVGLRECIADEVACDREPEFPPLDQETAWKFATLLYEHLTDLMCTTHAVEAAAIEDSIWDSGVATTREEGA